MTTIEVIALGLSLTTVREENNSCVGLLSLFPISAGETVRPRSNCRRSLVPLHSIRSVTTVFYWPYLSWWCVGLFRSCPSLLQIKTGETVRPRYNCRLSSGTNIHNRRVCQVLSRPYVFIWSGGGVVWHGFRSHEPCVSSLTAYVSVWLLALCRSAYGETNAIKGRVNPRERP